MNRLLRGMLLFLVLPANLVISQEPRAVADRLLEDLQGENKVGNPSDEAKSNPWQLVSEEMKRIAERLPRPAESKETLAAQSKLIEDLTKLLARAQAPSSTSNASPNTSSSMTQGSNRSQSASNNNQDNNQSATGNGPAAKAGDAGKSGIGGERNLTSSAETLIRRAWGQLPGRVRERLQSGAPEKFHEKYRTETENYFRRLSELEQRP